MGLRLRSRFRSVISLVFNKLSFGKTKARTSTSSKIRVSQKVKASKIKEKAPPNYLDFVSNSHSIMQPLEPRFMYDAALGAEVIVTVSNHAAEIVSDPDLAEINSSTNDVLDALIKSETTSDMAIQDPTTQTQQFDFLAPELTTGYEYSEYNTSAIHDAVTGDYYSFDKSLVKEIIFVDGAVDNYTQLLEGVDLNKLLAGELEIKILDENLGGIEQITDYLKQYDNQLETMHIVSHGNVAELQLGSDILNQDSLDNFNTDLASWGTSFLAGADILFYGCSVAEGALGQQFIQDLHNVIETDIAASSDLTGSSSLGGDWDFEVKQGEITAVLAFTATALNNYDAVLGDNVITVTTILDNDDGIGIYDEDDLEGNFSGTGDGLISLREAINAANNTAGTVTINFAAGAEGTINLLSALPAINSTIILDGTTAPNYVAPQTAASALAALGVIDPLTDRIDPTQLGSSLSVGATFSTTDAINNIKVKINLNNTGNGLVFNSGASGSQVKGLEIYNGVGRIININNNTDNITISENYLHGIIGGAGEDAIIFAGNASDNHIISNNIINDGFVDNNIDYGIYLKTYGGTLGAGTRIEFNTLDNNGHYTVWANGDADIFYNKVTNTLSGLWSIFGSGGTNIIGNDLSQLGDLGIASRYNTLIADNVIYDSSGAFAGIGVEGANSEVINNYITGISGYGIGPTDTNTVTLSQNLFKDNAPGFIPIDILANGLTADDIDDANNIQNKPIITSFVETAIPGVYEISGYIDSEAITNNRYRVEFFADQVGTEASVYLGSVLSSGTQLDANNPGVNLDDVQFQFIYDTNISGNVDLSAFLTISATATDTVALETSELSYFTTPAAIYSAIIVDTLVDSDDAVLVHGAGYTLSDLNANKGADGVISLREAIVASNNTPGHNTINFSVAGTINPTALFPTITEGVTINATTAPGYTVGTPTVEISDGYFFSNFQRLFSIASTSGATVIKGFEFDLTTNAAGTTVFGISNSSNVTLEENVFNGTTKFMRPMYISGTNNDINFINNIWNSTRSDAIYIQDTITDLTISGNIITSQVFTIPNDGYGIRLNVAGGSYGTITNNQIVGSSRDGVSIIGTGDSFFNLSNNVIYSNGDLAIDLGNTGLETNDSNDSDGGPNLHQNSPVLTNFDLVGNNLTIDGSLNSQSDNDLDTDYRIEFYADNDYNDPEARFYLGSITATIAAGTNDVTYSFNKDLTTLFGNGLSKYFVVRATATRITSIDDVIPAGDFPSGAAGVTSELSEALYFDEIYYVDNLGDVVDGDYSTGNFTLREAIQLTNISPVNPDRIGFAIDGTILLEPLPINFLTINDGLIIDGTTAPSYIPGTPSVIISNNGVFNGNNYGGLFFTDGTSNSVVRGLGFNIISGAIDKPGSITIFDDVNNPTAITDFLIEDNVFTSLGVDLGRANDGLTQFENITIQNNTFNTPGQVAISAGYIDFENLKILNNTINNSGVGISLRLAGFTAQGTGSGATATVSGNAITNSGAGIVVSITSHTNASLDITNNSITGVSYPPIDYRSDINSNPATDPEIGYSNNDTNDINVVNDNIQNSPVLISAFNPFGTDYLEITGSLNSEAGQTYRIEFYGDAGDDAQYYLGSKTVTTDTVLPTYDASFTFVYQGDLTNINNVTATATNLTRILTSETAPVVAKTTVVPTVITVTTTDDENDAGDLTLAGSLTPDGAGISLREAITIANSQPGIQFIEFAGGGLGTHTLLAALPTITETLSIDATSAVGYVFGSPVVTIDADITNSSVLSFAAGSDSSNIKGLDITSSTGTNNAAIDITDDTDNLRIQENTFRNFDYGVRTSGLGANNVLISQNLMSGISSLGIDLDNDGIDINDNLDSDTGDNFGQNYPVLTNLTVVGTTVTLDGTLNSLPNINYRIEIYASAGEVEDKMQFYLGSIDVVTDASGNASFTFVNNSVTNASDLVGFSATATNIQDGHVEQNSTSELSDELTINNTIFVSNIVTDVNGDTSSLANLLANDGGDGISLQEAIAVSNNSPRTQTIDFSLLDGADDAADGNADGFFTITYPTLGGTLSLTDSVIIDGRTAPGFTTQYVSYDYVNSNGDRVVSTFEVGVPVIQYRSNGISGFVTGMSIASSADHVEIYGLDISDSWTGVAIDRQVGQDSTSYAEGDIFQYNNWNASNGNKSGLVYNGNGFDAFATFSNNNVTNGVMNGVLYLANVNDVRVINNSFVNSFNFGGNVPPNGRAVGLSGGVSNIEITDNYFNTTSALITTGSIDGLEYLRNQHQGTGQTGFSNNPTIGISFTSNSPAEAITNVTISNNVFENSTSGIVFNGDEPTSTGIRITDNYFNGFTFDILNFDYPNTLTNDNLDTDTGPNGFQNYPAIASLVLNETTGLVDASIAFNSEANKEYRLDVYLSGAEDAIEVLYDTRVITTDGSGNYSYDLNIDPELPLSYLRTQATNVESGDPNENASSNFSPAQVLPVIYVDSLADVSDGDYSSGNLTLREAIVLSNTLAGAQTIRFRVQGTINMTDKGLFATESYALFDTTLIDGTTAPGYTDGSPTVIINSDTYSTTDATFQLDTGATGSIIKGLEIRPDSMNLSKRAFFLNGADNVEISSNVIHDAGTAIYVADTSTNIKITENSIYNVTTPIDLVGIGPFDNDNLDGDTGANYRINLPELSSSSVVGNSITIDGIYEGLPNTQFTIDFYANDTNQPNQPKIYLGSTTFTTNASGAAVYTFNTTNTNAGSFEYFTAIARNSDSGSVEENSTSEVSNVSKPNISVVVNTNTDVDDASIFFGNSNYTVAQLLANKGADGVISLREAIIATNNTVGADTITFGPGSTGFINLLTALPTINDALTIDGTTAPGFAVTGLTQNNPDGSNLFATTLPSPSVTLSQVPSASPDGIIINADDVTIKGLGFRDGDYFIRSSSDNTVIEYNWFQDRNFNLPNGGIYLSNATNAQINNNRFTDNFLQKTNVPIYLENSTDTIVEFNYIQNVDRGIVQDGGDATIRYNRILDVDAPIATDTAAIFADNANIIGNAISGVAENAAIVLTDPSAATLVQSNLIFNNSSNGINIEGTTTQGVNLQQNLFYNNTGISIDLGADGTTLNDPDDIDLGVNDLQNYPDLTAAYDLGNNLVRIIGTLNSEANTSYRIDFFADTLATDPEARFYLGSTTVTTDNTSTFDANFSFDFSGNIFASSRITATATNISTSSTSELSPAVAITALPTLTVDTTNDLDDAQVFFGNTNYTITDLLANRGADGLISLREAIIATNNTVGLDTIEFSVSGTIDLQSALPVITDSVVLNATTAPLFSFNDPRDTNPFDNKLDSPTDLNTTLTIRSDGTDGSNLVFASGSDGSIVRGFKLENDTTITNSAGVEVQSGVDGITIEQNHFVMEDSNTNDRAAISIVFDGVGDDSHIIQDNIIDGVAILNDTGIDGIIWDGGSVGTANNHDIDIVHNTITGLTGDSIKSINTITSTADLLIEDNVINTRFGDDAIVLTSAGGSGTVRDNELTDNGVLNGSGGDGINILANGTSESLYALEDNDFNNIGGTPVDLGGDGQTPNDVDDIDSGPNTLQNTVDLISAVSSKDFELDITGTFDAAPNTNYRVDFYADDGTGTLLKFDSINVSSGATSSDIAINHHFNGSIAGYDSIRVAVVNLDTSPNVSSEFSPATNIVAFRNGIIYVDSLSDDTTPGIGAAVDNNYSPGNLTLREAIELINNNSDFDTIDFSKLTAVDDANDIDGADGKYTIDLSGPLPVLTSTVTLDGTTAPGYAFTDPRLLDPNDNLLESPGDLNAVIIIRSDTSDGSNIVLDTGSDNSTIKGLRLENASSVAGSAGIDVRSGVGGITIEENHIVLQDDPTNAGIDRAAVSITFDSTPGSGDSQTIQNNIIEGAAGLNDAGVDGIAWDGGSDGSVNSHDLDILHNTISGLTDDALVASPNTNSTANLLIEDNVIDVSGGDNAIALTSSNGSGRIIDNTINDDGVQGGGDGDGISITHNGNSPSTYEITDNDFYLIGGEPIDLSGDGPTINDPNDADLGPNNLQNTPVLTSAVIYDADSLVITGTLDSEPSTNYRIDYYAVDAFGNISLLFSKNETSAANNNDIILSHQYDGSLAGITGIRSVAVNLDSTPNATSSEFSPTVTLQTIAAAGGLSVDNLSDDTTPTTGAAVDGDYTRGNLTLREAIELANASAGADIIKFDTLTATEDASDVDGSDGQFTIDLTGPLPTITDEVTIDGTNALGYGFTDPRLSDPSDNLLQAPGDLNAVVVIRSDTADGSNIILGTGSDNSTIRGLRLENSSSVSGAAGIEIQAGVDGITIEENHIILQDDPTNIGVNRAGISITFDSTPGSGDSQLIQNNVIEGEAGLNDVGVDGIAWNGGTDGALNTHNLDILHNTITGVTDDAIVASPNTNSTATLLIEDNVIDVSGGDNAIALTSSNGTGTITDNTITDDGVQSGADGDGISIAPNGNTPSIYEITDNEFSSIGGEPIDLSGDGITGNDLNDGDTGPNNLQNFADIDTAITSGPNLLEVSGSLNSTSGTNFEIHIYGVDSAGNIRLLGAEPVSTGVASNTVNFSYTYTGSNTNIESVRAVAVNISGVTPFGSEFSPEVTVQAAPLSSSTNNPLLSQLAIDGIAAGGNVEGLTGGSTIVNGEVITSGAVGANGGEISSGSEQDSTTNVAGDLLNSEGSTVLPSASGMSFGAGPIDGSGVLSSGVIDSTTTSSITSGVSGSSSMLGLGDATSTTASAFTDIEAESATVNLDEIADIIANATGNGEGGTGGGLSLASVAGISEGDLADAAGILTGSDNLANDGQASNVAVGGSDSDSSARAGGTLAGSDSGVAATMVGQKSAISGAVSSFSAVNIALTSATSATINDALTVASTGLANSTNTSSDFSSSITNTVGSGVVSTFGSTSSTASVVASMMFNSIFIAPIESGAAAVVGAGLGLGVVAGPHMYMAYMSGAHAGSSGFIPVVQNVFYNGMNSLANQMLSSHRLLFRVNLNINMFKNIGIFTGQDLNQEQDTELTDRCVCPACIAVKRMNAGHIKAKKGEV